MAGADPNQLTKSGGETILAYHTRRDVGEILRGALARKTASA